MRIVNFQVELLPNNEVLVNGRRVDNCKAEIEERTIKKMNIWHQWVLLCEVQKMYGILLENYLKARVDHGEITIKDYDNQRKVISAGGGIANVAPPLQRGKFTGRT